MSLTLTALEALYAVALAVGLRKGEASALRWEDIDLDAGTLTVRHALLRMKGRVELAEPRGSMRAPLQTIGLAVGECVRYQQRERRER